jgi:hypothetical protein
MKMNNRYLSIKFIILFLMAAGCLPFGDISGFSLGEISKSSSSVDSAGGISQNSAGEISLRATIGPGTEIHSCSEKYNLESGFLHHPGLADYDFEYGKDDWNFVPENIPDFPFSAPRKSDTGGCLMLSPSDTNTFGYFENAYNIPLQPERIYKFSFALHSNKDDSGIVPRFRLRTSLADFQESHINDIISMENGEASPDKTLEIYPLFYKPSQIAAQNGDMRPLAAMFDIVNIGAGDDLDAEIYLNYLRIDLFEESDLNPSIVKNYTFDSSDEAWTGVIQEEIGSPFASPDYTYDQASGRLAISVNDTKNNFGFWESSWALTEIPADSNRLFRATFTLRTDNDAPLTMPKIRIRLFTENFQAVSSLEVDARGNADLLPVPGAGRDYEVYIIPPSSAKSIKCSFDIVALDSPENPRIKNGTAVYLENCLVESMEIPEL